MLDTKACDTARRLPVSYTRLREGCGEKRLPLQFVWLKKGSHIRVPLAEDSPNARSIAHDPRDPRSPGPAAHLPRFRQALPMSLAASDFAKLPDRAITVQRPSYWLSIDATGRVTACETAQSSGNQAVDARTCELMVQRLRFTLITDIFGDVAANRQRQYVNLGGVL